MWSKLHNVTPRIYKEEFKENEWKSKQQAQGRKLSRLAGIKFNFHM